MRFQKVLNVTNIKQLCQQQHIIYVLVILLLGYKWREIWEL